MHKLSSFAFLEVFILGSGKVVADMNFEIPAYIFYPLWLLCGAMPIILCWSDIRAWLANDRFRGVMDAMWFAKEMLKAILLGVAAVIVLALVLDFAKDEILPGLLGWATPERPWSPEDRHRGLHCLTSEAEAYDGTKLSVNEGSIVMAKLYASDKDAFEIHGYQMCQANEEGWHPTWVWFRDRNATGGITYHVVVAQVMNDGCGVRDPKTVLRDVQPERLPPEPDWLMNIENCSASGYAGPNVRDSQ